MLLSRCDMTSQTTLVVNICSVHFLHILQQLEKEKEENKRLQQQLEQKDRRIIELERQVALLNKVSCPCHFAVFPPVNTAVCIKCVMYVVIECLCIFSELSPNHMCVCVRKKEKGCVCTGTFDGFFKVVVVFVLFCSYNHTLICEYYLL